MLKKLSTTEAYAFYVLQLLSGQELIDLAVKWMLDDQYTESLCLLAGENEPDPWTVNQLFESTMSELGIPKPDLQKATDIALVFYLNQIVNGTGDPVKIGNLIYRDIYHTVSEQTPDKNFVGDCIGIEHMCTWLREIWDAKDGSMLLYYTDLPKEKAVEKYTEHLVEEAGKLLEKINITT